jgi:hypothetical protein
VAHKHSPRHEGHCHGAVLMPRRPATALISIPPATTGALELVELLVVSEPSDALFLLATAAGTALLPPAVAVAAATAASLLLYRRVRQVKQYFF